MKKINSRQPKQKHMLSKVMKECACALRFPLFLNTVTAILTGVVGVAAANKLGEFADAVFQLNLPLSLRNIVALAACMAAVVFVVPGLGLLSDFVMLKSALRHDTIVFGHYLDKEPQKAMTLNRGELQYQLEDAPNELRIYWVNLLSKLLSLPFCLGYLLYCSGNVSWLLTGLIFLLTAVKLVIPLLFKEPLAAFDRQEKAFLAVQRDYEADAVTEPHIIKIFGIKNSVLDRLKKLFQDYYEETASRQVYCTVFCEQAKEFIDHFTLILMLLCGAVMVAQGTVSPGEFAAMFVYRGVVQMLLNDIGDIIQNYPLMINAANRVCEFYQDPEIVYNNPVQDFSNITGENLAFSYSDKKVFENLNFSIFRGDKVGIYGENGHGKSTLIKIICALLKNYRGNLKIGDEDFRTINIAKWRKMIAYAPQVPFLFHATVRENVTMQNSKVDKETVDTLMDDFGILSLADRNVDADSKLSGGEKQKISIVRALLKESKVLILDEPTNHLDQHSIAVLKRYLSGTTKTVILISHDPSLLDIIDYSIKI